MAIIATPDFVQGAPWNASVFSDYSPRPDTVTIAALQQKVDSLVHLSNADCLATYYNREFQSDWASVIVVGDVKASDLPGSSNTSIIDVFNHESDNVYNDLGWPCGGTLGISEGNPYTGCTSEPNPKDWTVSVRVCDVVDPDFSCSDFSPVNVPVRYCLAERGKPACAVKFSPTILLVVIACNAIKVLCLAGILCLRGFQPLLNVGDAIMSFLQNPDSTTAGTGPVSAIDARKQKTLNSANGARSYTPVHATQTPWKNCRYRWWHAASRKRWIVGGLL